MNIEKQIELDKVKEIWSALTVTDFAKELIEHGFEIAKRMNLKLPHQDCLMVKELCEGGLENIKGHVDYGFYKTLH